MIIRARHVRMCAHHCLNLRDGRRVRHFFSPETRERANANSPRQVSRRSLSVYKTHATIYHTILVESGMLRCAASEFSPVAKHRPVWSFSPNELLLVTPVDEVPGEWRAALNVARRAELADDVVKVARVQAVGGPDGAHVLRGERLALLDVLDDEE